MQVDLEKIAEENIRRYGTDIDKYGPVLLAHLYSDKTHFVFELMQNAEDAGAKNVAFRLFLDRLEFEHDGRPFNGADVRGICGLVSGTKSDDLTKIGRFGIGFKSVFAYTNSPQIHCQGLHFCIENYVLPKRIQARVTPSGKTCFVFPFNHDEVSPKEAGDDIRDRLTEFGAKTLLFLKNVKKVTCSENEAVLGVFSRGERGSTQVRHITLTSSKFDFEDKEKWLIFRAPLALPQGGEPTNTSVFVEIGYSIKKDKSGNEHVARVSDSPLVVFFPTEKETSLGFLVQGPYITTPARDNVPEKNPWNIHLVEETAKLAHKSLDLLKSMGLLEAQTLEALPIDDSDFYETDMFYPVSKSIRKAIWTDDLIPAQRGGYIAGEKGKLAKSADIPRLFIPTRLKELLQLPTMPKWISTDITSRKTPRLYSYLTSDLTAYTTPRSIGKVEGCGTEIGLDIIVDHLTVSFMQNQSESWVKEFYIFLGSRHEFHDALREKPIVRTQCGRFVCAYDQNGTPNVFLPSRSSGGYAIVKKSLAKVPEVKVFLDGLGIRVPDTTSEVLKYVLPKYGSTDGTTVPQKEHREDMEKIVAALKSESDLVFELEEILRITPFFRARNAKTGRLSYKLPSEIYARSAVLEMFFEGNRNVWFLDENTEGRIDWDDLGVRNGISVIKEKPDREGHIKLTHSGREYKRGLDGFDPSCEIEGLECALSSPSVERALFIWNELLVPNATAIAGVVQSATGYTFRSAHEVSTTSPMGKLVRESRWIPDGGGGYVKPSEIGADDLPEGFVRDEVLIKQLAMRPASIGLLADETGISVDILDQLRSDPGVFQEFLAWRDAQSSSVDEGGAVIDDDWPVGSEEYEDVQECKHSTGSVKGESSSGTPAGQNGRTAHIEFPENEPTNPERRARLVSAQAEDAPQRRTRTVTRSESVNLHAVKVEADPYLRAEYTDPDSVMHCQICGSPMPFKLADRNYYFEAVEFMELDNLHYQNYLALCPNHAAMFKHANGDKASLVRMFKGIDGVSLEIVLAGEDETIRFTKTHIADLKALIAWYQETSAKGSW